ncbi:hypothetical protein NON00_06720 [Roseomonas sp. GC11]|uniref:hypothetical protein n=1 Tax=Roseomonas sp. GC11 TaxID=2950546 RepID=UPI00210EE2AC|nr:hypothetical protein [Roseomonas sp. GC11]MCQ4159615.1 hypothetical protein [Roseomonas sp. GC11]
MIYALTFAVAPLLLPPLILRALRGRDPLARTVGLVVALAFAACLAAIAATLLLDLDTVPLPILLAGLLPCLAGGAVVLSMRQTE